MLMWPRQQATMNGVQFCCETHHEFSDKHRAAAGCEFYPGAMVDVAAFF